MIYIFHGDDSKSSRQKLLLQIPKTTDAEILRLDAKTINLDQINNFLFGPSLFASHKTLWLDNFFSISKPVLVKLTPLIHQSPIDVYLWQDKALNATQLKTFPQAHVDLSRPNNLIFKCLYALKPNNIKYSLPLYHQVINQGYYDLFLYLLKNQLRKNLNPKNLPIYLQLIQLDFDNKSGNLHLPKEIALEHLLLSLQCTN